MSVSRPADSSHPLPFAGRTTLRDDADESASYSLFGVRIDAFTPALAARVIFEGAADRRALRVVLADLWTLLLAQRDFSVWESLSAADYVLPAGDDPVVRRLTRRHHISPIWPDQLLNDLLLALEQSESRLVVLAPADEIGADLALIRQLWPRLRVTVVSMERQSESSVEHERLARAVNAGQPDILVVGGNSPWQERWTYQQRMLLQAGATVVLPTVQPVLAAIAQRSGLKVPPPARMRRRAAFQRAFEATLAPAAAASARALNDLLRGPRASLQQSPLGRWRLNPASLQRLSLLREARKNPVNPVAVRVAEWRGSDDSAIRRLTESPLARLGPPRGAPPLPALPPPAADDRELADQPTIIFSRDELRALLPDIVTGHIVELDAELDAATGAAAANPSGEVIALGPAGSAPLEAGDAAANGANLYTTTPLVADATTPLAADDPPPQAALSGAPPERVPAPPPLAPTTLLPGRPRRPKRDLATNPEPAQAPSTAPHAPDDPLPPSASIAAPAMRLEELNTLKAHLRARRRLLRRSRKLQSQRRRHAPA